MFAANAMRLGRSKGEKKSGKGRLPAFLSRKDSQKALVKNEAATPADSDEIPPPAADDDGADVVEELEAVEGQPEVEDDQAHLVQHQHSWTDERPTEERPTDAHALEEIEEMPPEQTPAPIVEAAPPTPTVVVSEDEAEEEPVFEEAVGPPSDLRPGPIARASEAGGLGLGVCVHRTDRLKTKHHVAKPKLRLLLLDASSGQGLTSRTNGTPMGPFVTKPCILNEDEQSSWEELIQLGDTLGGILASSRQPLLIFDLIDSRTLEEDPPLRIAWAFLKLPHVWNVDLEDLFSWFSKLGKAAFPGSLYVTLKTLKGTSGGRATRGSADEDPQRLEEDGAAEAASTEGESASEAPAVAVTWDRLPGQPCRIPNAQRLSLSPGPNGVTRLAFAPNGRQLACACGAQERSSDYHIVIYEIPSGAEIRRLRGHGKGTGPVQVFPHTSFVYAAVLHPTTDPRLVLTTAHDGHVRLWRHAERGLEGHMLIELSGHHGPIRAAALTKERRRLFTGDDSGLIRVWSLDAKEDGSAPLSLAREIKTSHLQGFAIGSLALDVGSRFCCVASRDGRLSSLDLRTGSLRKRFEGEGTSALLSPIEVSPCGRLLLAGYAHSAQVLFWEAQSGELVGRLRREEPWSIPSTAFHPLDHVLAVAFQDPGTPLLIYKWDENATELYTGAAVTRSTAEEKARRDADELSEALDFSLDKLLAKYRVLGKVADRHLRTAKDKDQGRLIQDGGGVAAAGSRGGRGQLARLRSIGDPDSRDRLKSIAPSDFGKDQGGLMRVGTEYVGDKIHLMPGDVVTVLEEISSEWLHVSFQGTTAYVPTLNLQKA